MFIVLIIVNLDFNSRNSFGPSCRYQDSKDSFPKNLTKSAMSVAARSSGKEPEVGESLSPRLPYQGFHAYPWNLQRHGPGPGGAGSGYPYNYYNANPYYRNWFHNYKEQWQQHWQRFRGAAHYNEKFSSILGKLPRSKCILYFRHLSLIVNCIGKEIPRFNHCLKKKLEITLNIHCLRDAPTRFVIEVIESSVYVLYIFLLTLLMCVRIMIHS